MERLKRKSLDSRCPLCKESLDGGLDDYTCSGCRTGYHVTCARELGGCGTLGCAKRGELPLSDVGPPSKLASERLVLLQGEVTQDDWSRWYRKMRAVAEKGSGEEVHIDTVDKLSFMLPFFAGCMGVLQMIESQAETMEAFGRTFVLREASPNQELFGMVLVAVSVLVFIAAYVRYRVKYLRA